MPKKAYKNAKRRVRRAAMRATTSGSSSRIYNSIGKRDRISSQGNLLRNTKLPFLDRGPFAPVLHTKLRYSERIAISTAAVTGLGGTEAIFRLGSLFDPNASGVGHQPYYYDQLTPLYWRYVVYGCTVQIEYTNCTDSNIVVMYMCAPGSSTADLVNLNSFDANERPGCGTIRGSAYGPACTTANLGYIPLPKLEGKTWNEYMGDETAYHANVGQNPQMSPLLRINCCSDSLSPDQQVYITVTMVFHCKLYNRRYQPQS